jgi:excinuclease ABC subunit B
MTTKDKPMKFKLKSDYQPTGDQPEAIKKLTNNYLAGVPYQVLLGVTGSGKTYTVANLIENIQKPALIISHNKTLAGQLYQEFKEYFPDNAVSYFVSYYDYYQPEAYVPQTDTYISKETDINQEIDKLRLQATSDIFSQDDVVVVASVSCIYNIGSPLEYKKWIVNFKVGDRISMEDFLYKLVSMHYSRSRLEFERGTFRQRGNIVEIYLSYSDEIVKVVFEDDRVDKISTRPVWETEQRQLRNCAIYPAKHYLTDPDVLKGAFHLIKEDLAIRLKQMKKEGKQIEAYRLEQRVNYDLEMMAETGYVNGVENYSRYFDGRNPGDPPYTLIDYFKEKFGNDYLIVVDESHMTIPQIRGMYHGDYSRKQTLIDFGFRLPSALDNRPLKFDEFMGLAPKMIFASATPDEWEIKKSKFQIAEQLIRPTGLVDPEVEVRPSEGQIQDLIQEILKRHKLNERVLVTTLTKRTAEDLSSFLADSKNTKEPILVNYLHADIDTFERSDILADLRGGKYDVLVGINLLREGLDLPEVSLVAILDADKQGFLRSRTSLIQTMGRAARNSAGKVILYADEVTEAMRLAIQEVERRRRIQKDYNEKHGITPMTISKPIRDRIVAKAEEEKPNYELDEMTPGEQQKLIPKLRRDMREAAKLLDFEKAIQIRDTINKIEKPV